MWQKRTGINVHGMASRRLHDRNSRSLYLFMEVLDATQAVLEIILIRHLIQTYRNSFKVATGTTLIGHVQNLRIEHAKRLLETGGAAFEQIAAEIGYENPAFFRRLFRRATGLTPGQYRRMFRPLAAAAELSGAADPA